jgi:hypothetical protein
MPHQRNEASPNETAYEMFGHLTAGDKVAITTRFQSPQVLEYVQAMKRRGLLVRVIVGQRDVEDFCFLVKAKRGLAGTYQSTFFRWAATLGQAERVQLSINQKHPNMTFSRKKWEYFRLH